MTYNRIYNKDKWNQVNKFNKDLLDDYILQCKAEGKSEGSIKQYFNDARIILIYVLDELDNKPLYKLTRKSFRNLTLWLKDNGLSAARINRMLSTTRNLLNFGLDDDEYAEDFEDMKANPSRIKGMQKEKVRDIVFLSMEEVNIIYNELMETQRYQEATMLGLLMDSAARRNEIYQVLKDTITEDGKFTNVVIGKRNKKFKLMYNDMTKKAFKLYMQQRGEDDIESLWISGVGDSKAKCSYETLYYRIVSWRDILNKHTGEYKEIGSHTFRHTSLELLAKGKHYLCEKLGGKKFELNELKLLANHESIETTSNYLQNNDEEELLVAFGLI